MKPLQILIVDASASGRTMVKACLDGIEWQADEAENGLAAVTRFLLGSYDLVLMDIDMPRMDGYAATRKIRQWEREHDRRSVPIIALSAEDQARAASAAREAGCNGFVPKPVDKVALHAAIRAATGLDIGSSAGGTGPPHRGLAQRLFGRLSKTSETPREDSPLEALRPEFLAAKLREVGVVMLALEHHQYQTARMLALRLKGEGTNFGFREITEIGGELAEAVEKMDPKGARKLAQKLAAYLSKAEASCQ